MSDIQPIALKINYVNNNFGHVHLVRPNEPMRAKPTTPPLMYQNIIKITYFTYRYNLVGTQYIKLDV